MALSCAFVRFPVTALGTSSTVFKACSLLLLEHSLGYDEDDRVHASNTPNGLLHKPTPNSEDHALEDFRVARDFAGTIAILSFLLSLAFESLKRYSIVYKAQQGAVGEIAEKLPRVRTLYNNWDAGADGVGIVWETVKVVALLLMVRRMIFPSLQAQKRDLRPTNQGTGAFNLRTSYKVLLRQAAATATSVSRNAVAFGNPCLDCHYQTDRPSIRTTTPELAHIKFTLNSTIIPTNTQILRSANKDPSITPSFP